MAHLTEEQLARIEEQGYLVVEGLFDPEQDLDPVIEEYAGVLDRLADELYENGEISSTYGDLTFGDRLTRIYAESGKVHAQYFDFSLPQKNVRADTPMWVGPAVFRLLRNEKLLDAVESLIGPEIYSNPCSTSASSRRSTCARSTKQRGTPSLAPRRGTRIRALSGRKPMRRIC